MAKTLPFFYFFGENQGFLDKDNKLVWEERQSLPLPIQRGCSLVYKER